MRKAALLFVSSSRWGGWHHVEVHKDEWWIRKYEMYGFKYDAALTQQVRGWAREEARRRDLGKAPNGNNWNAQHIWMSMKVFVNPVVGALPEHAHLFPEHGCYKKWNHTTQKLHSRPCLEEKGESVLDDSFFPITLTREMDTAWESHIQTQLTKGYNS